jgi:hypothetical protein
VQFTGVSPTIYADHRFVETDIMISFEESMKEIEGVTTFKLGKFRAWMKMRVLSFHGAAVGDVMTDAEVVDKFVRGAWLGHWGMATIGGQEVAVLEHLDVNHMGVVEAAALANRRTSGEALSFP